MKLPDASVCEEIHVGEVAEWIASDEEQSLRIIDCREAEEREICRIKGSEWIPLGNIPTAVEELNKDSSRYIVIYCHHGMRSLQATRYLRKNGLEFVFSMKGGIEAWSLSIDPTVPRY